MIHICPVFLCGGSGDRLWPLSTDHNPKQFISMPGFDNSLLVETYEVVSLLKKKTDIKIVKPVYVTNEKYRFILLNQLKANKIDADIIIEPDKRNTAPALTLASYFISSKYSDIDPVIVAMPCDHFFKNKNNLSDLIYKISQINNPSMLINLIGIKPKFASTQFGYIFHKKKLTQSTFYVESFHEKPSQMEAENYLNKKGYLWNSGIFILKNSTWIRAVKDSSADVDKFAKISIDNIKFDSYFYRPEAKSFIKSPSISVDYCVLENKKYWKDNLTVSPLSSDWSDLGSWSAISNLMIKDKFGNSFNNKLVLQDSSNNLVYSTDMKFTLLGINDLYVIQNNNEVFIRHRSIPDNHVKSIKNFNNENLFLNESDGFDYEVNYRPWGWFRNLNRGDGFRVKKLHLNPQSSISLQKHQKRSEHWVIVKGVAKIIIGKKQFICKKNESVFVPKGKKHRIINDSKKNCLEIIEVQSGNYCEEDDIIRYADEWNRK